MNATPAEPRDGSGCVPPAHDEETSPAAETDARGVDLSLVREALRRSPAERLDVADACAHAKTGQRWLARLPHGP